ncbi:MAG: thermonuclease family protein, partial [Bacteroidetes bacterium]|nr:thermonuclease family protein [Bacteroidota bacterium]MBU1717819.1 thermonuclease family protein [Bacteroidota bacterium]
IGTKYEFIKQNHQEINFENEILKLPYIFKDPHTLDKKIDIKKLQFGSKIDKDSSATREELFTVKEVINPEMIRLNNDLIIKLLGIKENPVANGKATSFLIEKTKGKRVFLKYDKEKYDQDNNLLCYLYLENKTFINAHLIKSGLVQVDSGIEYKFKEKFLKLQ